MIQFLQKPIVQMLRPWNFHINIDTQEEKAIYLQIADAIIYAIKTGNLKGGDALPGSRQLAIQLKVNRNTVVTALEILLAEGWIISKERKGTFVSETLPHIPSSSENKNLSIYSDSLKAKANIIFDDGFPDSKMAPVSELSRAYRQIFNRSAKWQMMGYSSPLGNFRFREAIVQMLNYNRGMNLNTDHLCITRGSQMAMYLAAQVIIQPGDFVVVENPGYTPAWNVFQKAGANILHTSVDREGMVVDELEQVLKHKRVKAVYVTPHHQYPTTVSLSLSRRLKLIELSNRYGFTIIEDDYDHEFHFHHRPLLPLSSHNELKNYLYIGSMSKIVAPALRIGYLAGQKNIIDKIAELRKIIDVQGDSIMELAVLDLIKSGVIKRHLRRSTTRYKQKRDLFFDILSEHLEGKAHLIKPGGGLAFWLTFKKENNLLQIYNKLLKRGVEIVPPQKFSSENLYHGIRLGYGSINENDFRKGINELSKLL